MKSRTLTWLTVVALFAALAIPVRQAAQGQQQNKQPRYKLVDIGTFGGPNSYFNLDTGRALNNRGQATGAADTSVAVSPPFCLVDCFLIHTFLWQDGVLTDLGAIPEQFAASGPNDINAKGVVTGVSFNGNFSTLGLPFFDAVVWKDGQIIDLGTFGGPLSYANQINDQDQAVGFALNTTPDSFDLGDFCQNFPMPTQMRAFIWQNGILHDLGTLGGTDSCALFVNQSGEATGQSFTNSVINPATGLPTMHPFLWDGSRLVDLGTLGGTVGTASWINDRGQIVGTSNLAGDLTAHPFLWDRGSLKDLGTLGGSFGVAASVSDAGDIVGGATNQNDQAFLAFVWKNGVITDLGTLPGDDCSMAHNVNSGGQIVGFSFPCAGGPSHAVLWERGSIIDLNAFVPAGSDLVLTEAFFINDRREIAVQAMLPNGDGRAVLLVPGGQGDSARTRAATQNSPAPNVPATHPRTVIQSGLTPNELRTALRARLGKRYRLPGPGAEPTN